MGISLEQYNKMAERLTELEYELAESVKVVRCKDCKHRETDECPMYWMEWLIIDEGDGYEDHDYIVHDYTTDDGYCNYGERKGGEDE